MPSPKRHGTKASRSLVAASTRPCAPTIQDLPPELQRAIANEVGSLFCRGKVCDEECLRKQEQMRRAYNVEILMYELDYSCEEVLDMGYESHELPDSDEEHYPLIGGECGCPYSWWVELTVHKGCVDMVGRSPIHGR